jgi:hypothetical protein
VPKRWLCCVTGGVPRPRDGRYLRLRKRTRDPTSHRYHHESATSAPNQERSIVQVLSNLLNLVHAVEIAFCTIFPFSCKSSVLRTVLYGSRWGITPLHPDLYAATDHDGRSFSSMLAPVAEISTLIR